MAKRALLLIDIQNDYFESGKWPLFEMSQAADNASKVLTSARRDEWLVIHVRHEFKSDQAPFFTPNSSGAQIHESVRPAAGEKTILKHEINSFKDTPLKKTLDEHAVTELTICGAMSHICIDAATRAAADYGYSVTVVHDACAAREAEFNGTKVSAHAVHSSFMSALAFGYAKVISTEEFLASKLQTV